jgi:hypothetical protein
MLQYTNGSRRAITGASLAQRRRRMSAAERACLGADIVDGRIVLQGLTVKAIAALVGVNVGYVDHALRLTPEQRAEVCRGSRPLVLPRTRGPAPIDWAKIDDATLVEAVRRIGLERTLDAAIAADHH